MQLVCLRSQIPSGTLYPLQYQDEKVLLLDDGETIRAFHRHCPHQNADLIHGHLQDGQLTCPMHRITFNLRQPNSEGYP